jgi:hypothetical protein
LGRERGTFENSTACPGACAPDGHFGEGFFVEQLQGQFTVAYFGARGPDLADRTLHIPPANEILFARYGVPAEGATYVFRPDGHVLARCTGIDGAFAREAIQAVLDYRSDA